MKHDEPDADLLPAYDFGKTPGGVRGKLATAYARGMNLAWLDPDVAAAFTTGESISEALRAVLKATAAIPRTTPDAR
jgi:hypothetical protein